MSGWVSPGYCGRCPLRCGWEKGTACSRLKVRANSGYFRRCPDTSRHVQTCLGVSRSVQARRCGTR
jgi:hypothetical protein